MIIRDFAAATGREFDLVIVGGGIYGVSLLQQAARCGLSACLCEARDFGSGTSWNSLRIVHGGLRYLQTMDLPRFFQSVAARRRMAQQFPSLLRPLRCVLPLYGEGLKRVSVMRVALWINDLLSAQRDAGLSEALRLPAGGVLDAEATRRECGWVRGEQLQGAAYWSDYAMVSSERIIIELLHDACRHGAVALNYAPVQEVTINAGVARGVLVRDAITGKERTIAARTVVNCAGPRVRELARGNGGDTVRLFRPSLAFNILLDVALPGDSALAVAPPQRGAPILFVVPQPGSTLAGTMHLPRSVDTVEAVPTEAELEHFLTLLNAAIPGLNARRHNICRIFAGLLPAAAGLSAKLAKRAVLEDHGKAGGCKGLYSVSGVKFTTANNVAREILERFIGCHPDDEVSAAPLAQETAVLTDARSLWTLDDATLSELLERVANEEAVRNLEDLVLRRTNWGVGELDLERIRERLTGLWRPPDALRRGLACG